MSFILRLLKPFQIWIQRLGYQEPKLTKEDVMRMMNLIRAGDVLGSYESGRITSLFIKGEYDHLAIVDGGLYVVEAVGDYFIDGVNHGGVRQVPIEDWLWRKNHIFIARHRNPEVRHKASVRASEIAQLDPDYDYGFSWSNNKLYCSELVKKCFVSALPAFMRTKKVVLPIDFFNHSDFIILYDTRREHEKRTTGTISPRNG